MHRYTIADVARRLGVSTSTLRRWHRERRLDFEPERDAVGRRTYSELQVEEIRLLLLQLHPRLGQ
jgi:excisionase family DNA binding protein